MKEKGIDVISTDMRKIVESDDVLQSMALNVALGKAVVCRGFKGIPFDLSGKRLEYPSGNSAYLCKGQSNVVLDRIELIEKAKGFPYIVIDCVFFDDHSEKEKKKIILQIQQSLSVVRRYMWDEKLIVTNLKCGVGVYYPSTVDFIRECGVKNVVLLDPNGEEEFRGQKADCYIIGGIVDKSGSKRGWTSKIGDLLRGCGVDFKSLKIVLRDDVVGVPDRLNAITEIVLRVVLDGMNVENAIRCVQSPLVARWRLKKEIAKKTVRIDVNGKPFRVVRRSVFGDFDWLNLRLKDFYDVCGELGFLVVDDSKVEEIIKKAEYDDKKKRWVLIT